MQIGKEQTDAMLRWQDGYLAVNYDKFGLKFESYDQWIGSGAKIPGATVQH